MRRAHAAGFSGINEPAAVTVWCETNSDFGPIRLVEVLEGGAVNLTRRLTCVSGRQLVLKSPAHHAGFEHLYPIPPGLYELEAAGLRALQDADAFRVPVVHLALPDALLLEDLGSNHPGAGAYEEAGRRLALQHRSVSRLFGWRTDNFLGLLPQHNTWSDDGHAFFAEHRILRFLRVRRCATAISPGDRRRVERLAGRLPEFIPSQPACLLHGDLWHANMLVDLNVRAAVVDPAVYYGWPEAELSMIHGCGGIPDSFYAGYQEVHPLEPGWRDRLPLLHIREVLSVIAHFGSQPRALGQLTDILDRYS